MKVYKLTTHDGKTRTGRPNETQWGEGVTHETSGSGKLCGEGWLHFYYHPILAVILNPNHANFNLSTAKLWEAEAEGEFADDQGRKGGCTRLTTIRQIDMPVLTTADKTAFAILCAKTVYHDASWLAWADNWLLGVDRTRQSAKTARYAAYDDAYYAAAAYSAYAAYAADAAADAAYTADAALYLSVIAQWEQWRVEEQARKQARKQAS